MNIEMPTMPCPEGYHYVYRGVGWSSNGKPVRFICRSEGFPWSNRGLDLENSLEVASGFSTLDYVEIVKDEDEFLEYEEKVDHYAFYCEDGETIKISKAQLKLAKTFVEESCRLHTSDVDDINIDGITIDCSFLCEVNLKDYSIPEYIEFQNKGRSGWCVYKNLVGGFSDFLNKDLTWGGGDWFPTEEAAHKAYFDSTNK